MTIRTRVPSPIYTMPPSSASRPRTFPDDPSVKPGGESTEMFANGAEPEQVFQEVSTARERFQMGLVVLLLVLALLFGGIGLASSALWWMLIIAGALLIASAFSGFGRRRTW